ncbi:MAG: tyrosine-type recombinase/integrase [Gammaproteobacteria bacterium]|nr:tyrosine-type recombinase/integrase [Gammaproteobacteria bacterium]
MQNEQKADSARNLLQLQPLESLQLPKALDGSEGSNRSPGAALIEASTDLQAIQTWLMEYQGSPHTLRNYRREVERLLLWGLRERGKPLSSLIREDFLAYQNFLADPQPIKLWVGARKPRFSPDWRPFQGALHAVSIRQALVIINSLLTYLVHAGYLTANPLALMRRRTQFNPTTPKNSVERFLDQESWQKVLEQIDFLPRDSKRQEAHYQRVKFLFTLLYLLGPRVSEVSNHNMGSFIESRGNWWWRVTGKGNKTAQIPVNDEMLSALANYRTYLQKSPLPAPSDATPIALSLGGKKGIGANMVYRIVKKVMLDTAEQIQAEFPHKAEKLRLASTHWLRHTSITHQADAGIELRYLNKNARHAKLETTAIYLHSEDAAWHEAMQSHAMEKIKSKK